MYSHEKTLEIGIGVLSNLDLNGLILFGKSTNNQAICLQEVESPQYERAFLYLVS